MIPDALIGSVKAVPKTAEPPIRATPRTGDSPRTRVPYLAPGLSPIAGSVARYPTFETVALAIANAHMWP